MFEKIKKKGFQVLALHHAEAILKHDMSSAINEIETVLLDVSIPVKELVYGGGGEGELTQRLRRALADKYGWKKHIFEVKKIVDGKEKESISHEIDHVKEFAQGTFALEIEWNNKDPFYDRDLENFKRLHADGVISIGAIITRGESLQNGMREIIEAFARKEGVDDFSKLSQFYTPTPRQKELIEKARKSKGSFEEGWAHTFVADKFGEATTRRADASGRRCFVGAP